MKRTTRRPSSSSRTTNIAGQQQADIGLGTQRAVSQARIAGTKNTIGSPVDTKLVLHGGLHVNLSEHSEALGLENVDYTCDGFGKVLVADLAMEAVG